MTGMTKNFLKGFLAISFGVIAILPTFANTTDLNFTAIIDDYTILRIEDAATNIPISTDAATTQDPISPAMTGVLDFGHINGLGYGTGISGDMTVNEAGLTKKYIKTTDDSILATALDATDIETVKGVMIYLDSTANTGLQVRSLTSNDVKRKISVKNMTGDLANSGLDVLLAEDMTAAGVLADYKTAKVPSGLTAATVFKASADSFATFPLDVGIYVPRGHVAVTTRTVTLTFTSDATD